MRHTQSAPRVAAMVTAALAMLLAWAGAPADARGQVAVGDSLWQAGRIAEAQAAYLRAVEADRNSVRANFRIAQALAWSSQTDSALLYLRQARERVPDDPDLLFSEATFLAWARRFDEALLRYDSLIAAHPGPDFAYVRAARARTLSWAGRLEDAAAGYEETLALAPEERDARFGLAQIDQWSGALEAAAERYEGLLAEDPTEARSLAGLARVRLAQSRSAAAADLLDRVPADAVDADVKAVRQAVRDARAPAVELSSAWSEDSDGNVNDWQVLTGSFMAVGNVRAGVTLGWLDADDAVRSSGRTLAEASVTLPFLRGVLGAALGARWLEPALRVPGEGEADDRTALTGRVHTRQRLSPGLALTVAASRWPFDEIAAISALALDVTQADATLEARLSTSTSLTATGAMLAFSDDNRRLGANGRLLHRLPAGFSTGINASWIGYDFRAPRYFSPGAFRAAEVLGTWGREGPRWGLHLGGGFGAQKVDSAAVQRQWSAEARMAYTQGPWRAELAAGESTSAAATAVGAFRYQTVSVRLRRRF